MSRPATSLSTRLRARTISLAVPYAQRPISLSAEAAKARTAQWEPTLHLDALDSVTEQPDSDNQIGADELPHMTTYSAFDPGAMRSLLHSSVAMSVPKLGVMALPNMMPRHGVVVANGVEKDEVEHVVGDKSHTTTTTTMATISAATTTAVTVPFKPWPYSLPAFLRPKVGTTFEMMHHTTTTITATTAASALESVEAETALRHIGVLQALLYGVSDPEKFSYTKEVVVEGGALHKVLYGVKESEIIGHGREIEVKIGENQDAAIVFVQETKVQKFEVGVEKVEVEAKGFDMIAK